MNLARRALGGLSRRAMGLARRALGPARRALGLARLASTHFCIDADPDPGLRSFDPREEPCESASE